MSDTVIRVENLSKKYILSHQQTERYTTLRDSLSKGAKNLFSVFKQSKSQARNSQEEFWALKDVCFEIKQGDRVGIIGRNGAGKSTLLKVLSRIVEPTHGSIRIRGRVASLLEVGTGFHPELTGRENIFLNGAILGMSKVEIKRKFDEIVAFAEVEKFLDTPVKRYSSGMYVRLAFAVAAHLEPEILIVDEVLAVGDAQFQKKCLGKMEQVGREGRTVLFVSHNIGVVQSLCNRGVFLQKGQIVCSSSIQQTVSAYLSTFQDIIAQSPGVVFQSKALKSHDNFQVLKIVLLDQNLALKTTVQTWDYLRIRIHYFIPRKVTSGGIELWISTSTGNRLIEYSTQPLSGLEMSLPPGEGHIDCVIPELPLAAGSYRISVGISVPMSEWLCLKEDIGYLEVNAKDIYGSNHPPEQARTPIAVKHYWESPETKKFSEILN